MDIEQPLYSAAQVGAFDARAIREFGIPGYTLMQRAAAAAYAELKASWPGAERLLILAGPGNNGGDAVDLARQARQDGRRVNVILLADPQRLKGEAAKAYAAASAAGLQCQAVETLERELETADVIVDGLLGTGLSRPVSAAFAAVIEKINASGRPVLALDVPSGLGADSGAVMGQAVRADLTVSFIGRKQGLYTGAARDHCGRLAFSDLAVPAALYQGTEPASALLDGAMLSGMLPARRKDSHKGSFGHVLCLGGGPGYSGAIRLCALAALRGGAGLVSVLTHPDNAAVVSQAQAEMMVRGLSADHPRLAALLQRASVLAVGPGLGRDDWAQSMLQHALQADRPLVLDADALQLLPAGRQLPADSIITPHPGEAAALLGVSSAEIQQDRLQAASQLAADRQVITVLKGAGSIIASPDGRRWICDAGNPGMATGGMGDLLTGLIAALRAQHLPALEAAAAGTLIHAMAGDQAAQQGQRGLLPSDLLPLLRPLLNP